MKREPLINLFATDQNDGTDTILLTLCAAFILLAVWGIGQAIQFIVANV